MKSIAVDLDHIGTAVRDLDRGASAFERLGFQLTPRSHHKGAATAGGPIVDWGSANHCAMLTQGYLEVLGIVDDSKFSSAQALLAKYEGPHIVAFRPESAEAVQSLIDAGMPVDIVRNLERQVPYGPDGQESKRVAFRNLRFSSPPFTEAQFQYTEHLTRDVMWQPHLLTHPNGALALDRVYFCSDDIQALAAKLSPVLGVEPVTVRPGEVELRLAASAVSIVDPPTWNALSLEVPAHRTPAPVGYTVRTSSLERTENVLTRNEVPFTTYPGGLCVGSRHACGNVIHFIERN